VPGPRVVNRPVVAEAVEEAAIWIQCVRVVEGERLGDMVLQELSVREVGYWCGLVQATPLLLTA
jgi:hypothetical protein